MLTAKSLQSCLTLCNPIDSLLPGSSVPGILQARTWEWVAISSSNVWKWKVKVKSLSRVRLLTTSWTAAYQAPPSMGFSRREYWSGVPLPSPKCHERGPIKYTFQIYHRWNFPPNCIFPTIDIGEKNSEEITNWLIPQYHFWEILSHSSYNCLWRLSDRQ